jgi:hypothetical protein
MPTAKKRLAPKGPKIIYQNMLRYSGAIIRADVGEQALHTMITESLVLIKEVQERLLAAAIQSRARRVAAEAGYSPPAFPCSSQVVLVYIGVWEEVTTSAQNSIHDTVRHMIQSTGFYSLECLKEEFHWVWATVAGLGLDPRLLQLDDPDAKGAWITAILQDTE